MQSTSSAVVRLHKALSAVLAITVIGALQSSALALSTDQFAVQVSATVQKSPPKITLTWKADSGATGYTVYRKSLGSTSWGTGTNVSTSANTYSDSNVSVGQVYEYRIVKTGSGYTGYGYICSGIEANLIERRGKVILLVDSTYTSSLASELARLQQDLVGDGWQVIRRDVPRSASVTTVKNMIRNDYNSDLGNVKSVYIIGHVAVPYSGNKAFDGHGSEHDGAWAADVFYGEMNGTWTDSSVNNTGQLYSSCANVPGDGKYDQITIPSDVELQVGRVDLTRLTKFSSNDTELTRNYLNKAHRFRHKQMNLPRKGYVVDNFGVFGSESFASNAFRNFPPFTGASNVYKGGSGTFFSTLTSNAHQFAYGCGGGQTSSCSGVGNSSDFATKDPQTNFTMFFGSWFGDWDQTDNFLRSAIASRSYVLTSCWAGRPHWQYHPMGMGETTGYCAKLTQNNNGLYVTGSSPRGIHIALMGDPTLRLHAVTPPSGLTVSSGTLRWNASPDSVAGYHVYKASSAAGPFTRLNSSLITGTSFTDTTGGSGTYMVRAVKVEVCSSGTYMNPSQGIFSTGSGSTPPPPTSGTGTGLAAEYFDNMDLTSLKLTRTDATVNFDWGYGSPSSTIASDTFSARWSGQVEAQKSETYTFYTQSDDGVRLWVNGVQLVNRWIDQGLTEMSGSITLTAGQKYSIKMEYYDNGGNAVAKLLWSSPTTAKSAIPQSQLYPATVAPPPSGTGDGLTGEYFDNWDLTNRKLTRVDPTVNFSWGTGSPASGIASDSFSVRWSGTIKPTTSATYTFYGTADDGLRLWVNNQLLIDRWNAQAMVEWSGSITLQAGQSYPIRVEYIEEGGGASMKLQWSSSSMAKQIVPQAVLYSNSAAAIETAAIRSLDSTESEYGSGVESTTTDGTRSTEAVKPPAPPGVEDF